MIDRTAGVTAAQGFVAAGVAAGLRRSGKKDLAVVVSQGPRWTAAGVFTSNRFSAAPVRWSRRVLRDGALRAVVLNSGCANACTGAQGEVDAARMAELTAARLGCPVGEVGVASTGLIGQYLPMAQVESGIALGVAALTGDGGAAAAEAIRTTDTVSKQASVSSPAGWVVGGMAKGAGMLAPGLATMLVVLTTDADLTGLDVDAVLAGACRVSFERADSDGCMSTNDSVYLLANGASGIVPDAGEFERALTAVAIDLAQQLIADAEGARHAIAVTVEAAATEADALEVARAVARSNLFKCAIAGNDPNWGRVLAAVGTTGAGFDPADVSVGFNGLSVFRRGQPGDDRDQVDLSGFDVAVTIDLAAGGASATIWTNDLTHEYVAINADYSS